MAQVIETAGSWLKKIAAPSGGHSVQNLQSLFKIEFLLNFKLVSQGFQSVNYLMNLLEGTDDKKVVIIIMLTS